MRLSERKKQSMRGERSGSGFIGRYLAWMRNDVDDGPAAAEGLISDVEKAFTTEEGLRVLILMEKAVLLSSVPDGSDDRALREVNAVRNFVLEIRRIVTNGGK